MTQTARWLSCLLLALVVAAACGSADSSTSVIVRNSSNVTLQTREVGVNGGADIVTELAPGAKRDTLWRFSSGSRVTLKAEESGGRLVFCRSFSYDDIRRSGGEVTLVTGTLECK